MAVTYNKNNQTSGLNSDTRVNTELTAIQTAFQDCVSRSGGAPNAMSADFDMGGNDILNAGTVNCSDFLIDGQPLASLADLTAQAAAAAASETAAAASAAAAAASAAGVNLPSAAGVGYLLRVNSGETGYELTATIDTAQITDANITEAKLASGAVTADKIGTDAVVTAKIQDGAVTAAKLATPIRVPVSLATGSFTAASTQDLATLFSAVATHEFYRLYFRDMKLTGTGTGSLKLRVSVDGSTFRSTAGDYAYNVAEQDVGSATIVVTQSAAATEVELTGTAMATDDIIDGHIDFWFPKDATRNTVIKSLVFTKVDSTGSVSMETGIGHYNATTDDLTGIQLLLSGSKTFQASGTYELFGSDSPF